MPLRGLSHSSLVSRPDPYFKSLSELDDWTTSRRYHDKRIFKDVLRYVPRTGDSKMKEQRGSLLVCHDYKGGYVESPTALSYTFNYWNLCHTFIYFSHNRVSMPPAGWIDAAHRQGTKMLGTLIFEHSEGEADILRLLVGALPARSKSGPAVPSAAHPSMASLPLSPHYAIWLAELAADRGFDGYLLNVEVALIGGLEQTRILAAWIAILRQELKEKVGNHAECIWYDSVVITGQLRWQDRLNNYNVPFHLPATGFFTNYTWRPQYPELTARYFDKVSKHDGKTRSDIYIGVDVWGRGQHGGGGMGSYRALAHLLPSKVSSPNFPTFGLSAALFGNAWTWESIQDSPSFTWEIWWAYERVLWSGPPLDAPPVDVPPFESREGEPRCEHGPFQPIANFVQPAPPPEIHELSLYVGFSPGVGRAWWIEGKRVWEACHCPDDQGCNQACGWTDVGKQTSLGDQLWPHPVIAWADPAGEAPLAERGDDVLPTAHPKLLMDDAWNGGSCVQLDICGPGTGADDAIFRCLWVPVQTIRAQPNKECEATFVWKRVAGLGDEDVSVELDVALGVQCGQSRVPSIPVDDKGLANDWSKLVVRFTLLGSSIEPEAASVGLNIGFATSDPSQPYKFSILLGQLAVYPTPSPLQSFPSVIWADWTAYDASGAAATATNPAGDASNKPLGTLTWGTASILPLPAPLTAVPDPEDPRPIWSPDDPSLSRIEFLYFNVYALPNTRAPEGPSAAVWVGTSGLGGGHVGSARERLWIERSMLPSDVTQRARFYVQGVTSRGDVLAWESSTYVDVHL